MNAIGFVKEFKAGKLTYRKCLDWDQLTHPQREYICRWAGVAFEQGSFAILAFILAQSFKILVWPGQMGFMAERLVTRHAAGSPLSVLQAEKNLRHAVPVNVHGWSPKGKALLQLLTTITHWRTMRQSIFGAADSKPSYAAKPAFHVSRGLKVVVQTPMPAYADHNDMAAELRRLAS